MSMTEIDEQLARDETAALAIYEQSIQPLITLDDAAKFVAVAVESGDFELDAEDTAALNQLLSRRPGARVWLMRVGPEPAYRMAGAGRGAGA